MRKKRKRKKRTRTGNRLLLLFALLFCCALCPAKDKDKEKKPKASETWAVIAGTVFRDPGFALPGAEITLEPDKDKPPGVKTKAQKAVSDSRGEYAFRVPVNPLRYTVSVRAIGFRPEEKQVQIQGEQRMDVYFQLQPEAAKP